MDVKLLPCPFCAGSAQLLNGGPGNWFVRCESCKAATNDVGYEHAVELWNMRHYLAPNIRDKHPD